MCCCPQLDNKVWDCNILREGGWVGTVSVLKQYFIALKFSRRFNINYTCIIIIVLYTYTLHVIMMYLKYSLLLSLIYTAVHNLCVSIYMYMLPFIYMYMYIYIYIYIYIYMYYNYVFLIVV